MSNCTRREEGREGMEETVACARVERASTRAQKMMHFEAGSSTEELQDEAGTSQERSAEELRKRLRKSFRKSHGSSKEAPRRS